MFNKTLSSICPQPKPTKGRMRIHCLENVDKALQFLKEQRVHLENMGSHDIVDGNHRLTLGLIWTIILRFQVQHHFYFDLLQFSQFTEFLPCFVLWLCVCNRSRTSVWRQKTIKRSVQLRMLCCCGVRWRPQGEHSSRFKTEARVNMRSMTDCSRVCVCFTAIPTSTSTTSAPAGETAWLSMPSFTNTGTHFKNVKTLSFLFHLATFNNKSW